MKIQEWRQPFAASILVKRYERGSVLRIMEERALWRLDRVSTENQEYIGQKIF